MKIISLAILIDDEKNVRPNEFYIKGWGFLLKMKVPIVKITDYLWDEKKKKQLVRSTNPMAMVVRAQLKSLELKGTDAERRYVAKCELLRECRRRDYGCDPTRILFRYIGWTIRIPDELEKKLKQEINRFEEDKTMHYMPIWEKDAWDEGYGKGKDEGKEKNTLDIIKKMFQRGTDINFIASVTDMSIEEIKRLAVETPLTQTVQ
jgi:hypothetical protein